MDSLLLKEREIGGKKACLAVVCDGVGSMADGAFAASRAVHLLCEWMDRLTDGSRIGLRLRDEVLRINRVILNESRTNGLKTATTFSGLLLIENRYYIVHMGDSRIYGYQNGTLELLTTDHSINGKLTSCLGCTENPIVCYNEGFSEERRFLLCSDGLYKKNRYGIAAG